jgi:protein TonB
MFSDNLRGNFAGSLTLHLLVFGLILGGSYLFHISGHSWGDVNPTEGAVQATMVNALPLPPKQPTNADNVLTSEKPTPAPTEAKPKTEEAPKPDAVPIPVKPTKPPKVADKTTPEPPKHPEPPKPQTNKATTGETSGVRIAMSSTQTSAGTISVGIPDAGFGVRYAYYVQQLKQKVASQWYTSMLDSRAAGHRVYITFQVERDGTPSHIQIETPSGDATLDQTALRAVQHIETFGPLPDGYSGSHINVQYYFDPPAHP